MAEAHIQIEVGKVKFTAEGSPEWVDKKYEEFLRHMTELQRLLQQLRRRNLRIES